MHESTAKRVAELPVAQRPADLPEETHLVEGTLEGHGATSLASEKALLSAKVVKVERTPSGGVAYQFAIFVSEPAAPQPVEEVKQPTTYDKCIAFYKEKGFTDEAAKELVERFGVERVMQQVKKEEDEAFEKTLAGPTKASA